MASLDENIAFLYPAQASRVQDELQALLRRHKPALAARAKKAAPPAYSEKDTVLITYADHVSEPGKPTLATMHAFLNEFAKDISTVHVLPFYPYSSDDGFAVIDYYAVKPEFGAWSDLQAMHQDFSLMYDFVANHVSASSLWFQKFTQGDAEYADFFLAYDEPIDTTAVYRPRTSPLLTAFQTASGQKQVWTTFSADQIDLNVNNPKVLLALVDVLLFYIEHGADIIRFDAVGYLWKDPATSSAHLPQTHAVIKIFRQIIDELAPDVSFVTQANTRQDINLTYFGNGSDEAHIIYNYALPPLLLHAFIAGDSTRLTTWAKSLEYPSDKTTYLNITASHDGIGLQPLKGLVSAAEIDVMITQVAKRGARVNYRAVSDGRQEPYEINATYKSALGSAEKLLASQAIQLSLRGIPGIYLNSLFGEENWTEGVEKSGNNRAINRRKFGYAQLRSELLDPATEKHTVYSAYKQMLKVRAAEPLFSPAATQEVLGLHSQLFAVKRLRGDDALLAITNISPASVAINDLAALFTQSSAVDILSGTAVDPAQPLTLKPYETVWLK